MEIDDLGITPDILAPPPTAERLGEDCTEYESPRGESPPGDAVIVPTGERRESLASGVSSKSVEIVGEEEPLVMATVDTEEYNKDQIAEHGETELPEIQDDQGSEVTGVERQDTGTDSQNANSQYARMKVKFYDIDSERYKSYDGPLITSEQLALPGEDLTELNFCKHFNPSLSGSSSSANEAANRSYIECSDGFLGQGMERTLNSFNSHAVSSLKRTINFVAFRDAIHHAARLSRALVS